MKLKKRLLTALMLFAMLCLICMQATAENVEEALTENVEEALTEDYEEDLEYEDDYEYEEVFREWNEDAPSLQVLIDYLESVTNEDSPDFIPDEDRIAVFDMDGTLYGELFPTYLEYYMLAWRILKDPSIEPDAEMLALGRELRESVITHEFAEDMPIRHAIQAARAYAGFTINEFSDFVTEILLRDVDGFEGMTYGEAFYLPMIEVIEYLYDNDFKVYVCSGSDRFICRTLFEGIAEIPDENIIGMDVAMVASGQDGADGLDYVYTMDDELIRSDKLLIKNLKMNKVSQIARDIGKQPVLSFGNSSGDVSMHNYALNDNPYKSAAFMLIADDEERDYGNTEKAEGLREKWEESGYTVISMKNDFRTIYGDDVVKTGSFRWAEELADSRVAVDDPEDEADVRYMMYLGTNDKDTGKPVFTEAEAKEQLKKILAEHFGGYTIQEAAGGWTDDSGQINEEYTLVIILSDTTIDAVHAAADELISAFNQSSVMIEAIDTKTEFYGG